MRENLFPYFVGIHSLEEIASPENKVCVMNILGNESSKVTPVSHVYSGGNVVAGVQYGRSAKLATPMGDIPVYSRLAEVIEKHTFDTGVIYLPPTAVFHAVTELCHYNKQLKKIVIVTEKLSVKDQRLIRAVCQANKIDVFGANSLGIADTWNKVRIGGGLGGDKPEESLVKGSIAIHSNSGNFSTTISEYLKTQGFGTTTVVSSGKDVIIQYPVAEFLYAAENDPRTKAVVLYVEPGGYYEKTALDLIQSGKLKFTKPMVVNVTGRWKSNLSRAVGHAGALAGVNDDAESKEKWFDEYLGVADFDPDNPQAVSTKGVRVQSIQHLPLAMKAVYEKNNQPVDFEPMGDLALKPWFANDFGLDLPDSLKISVVEAQEPYNIEIEQVKKQLGATFFRQPMRNASGASRMNPNSLIAELHGASVTELTKYSFEQNIFFSILKTHIPEQDIALANLVLNYLSKTDSIYFDMVQQAKENNATPNQTLMAPLTLMGDHPEFIESREYMLGLLKTLCELGVREPQSEVDHDLARNTAGKIFTNKSKKISELTPFLLSVVEKRKNDSNVMGFAQAYLATEPDIDIDLFIINAVLLHLAFPAMGYKRISKETVENLYAYLSIEARMTVLSGSFGNKYPKIVEIADRTNPESLYTSFGEIAYLSVFGITPTNQEQKEFSALLALTLTNGPGTISAKGAKESVSARNNISTNYIGFLANTGLAHGGSGFEAVEFLLESFGNSPIDNPGHEIDKATLEELAQSAAEKYKGYKAERKLAGDTNYRKIPCINHPVFKGAAVNIDPREAFLYEDFTGNGIKNVFWEFYHHLVEALYKTGVSKNVYCVNIDAVIAVITLKLMWKSYKSRSISEKEMQHIGFTIFLLGRMAGVTAEIIDHTDRGQDMDCRTPNSQTKFVV